MSFFVLFFDAATELKHGITRLEGKFSLDSRHVSVPHEATKEIENLPCSSQLL